MSDSELKAVEADRDVKVAAVNEKAASSPDRWAPPEEWIERLKAEYLGQHGGETLPAGNDPDRVAYAIFTMNEEESVKILKSLIEGHQHDYTMDQVLMRRMIELVEGHEACEMEHGEWAYVTCKTAGMSYNWSPYAEVRAVTLPYDDPEEACESVRAYILGFFWVCVCTAINTCESRPAPILGFPSVNPQ